MSAPRWEGLLVDGVWIRTVGSEASSSRAVEVLLEVEGAWRIVDTVPLERMTDGEVSVIHEPGGLPKWPVDDAVDPRASHCDGGG